MVPKLTIRPQPLSRIAGTRGVTSRAAEIDYVDLRYGNGFTIGWKGGTDSPHRESPRSEREMLAARGAD